MLSQEFVDVCLKNPRRSPFARTCNSSNKEEEEEEEEEESENKFRGARLSEKNYALFF